MLTGLRGTIKLDNTLDTRAKLAIRDLEPVVRYMLFPSCRSKAVVKPSPCVRFARAAPSPPPHTHPTTPASHPPPPVRRCLRARPLPCALLACVMHLCARVCAATAACGFTPPHGFPCVRVCECASVLCVCVCVCVDAGSPLLTTTRRLLPTLVVFLSRSGAVQYARGFSLVRFQCMSLNEHRSREAGAGRVGCWAHDVGGFGPTPKKPTASAALSRGEHGSHCDTPLRRRGVSLY